MLANVCKLSGAYSILNIHSLSEIIFSFVAISTLLCRQVSSPKKDLNDTGEHAKASQGARTPVCTFIGLGYSQVLYDIYSTCLSQKFPLTNEIWKSNGSIQVDRRVFRA